MGLYLSIVNLAEAIAGMGVNTAGVRQIAVAVGSGDTGHIARTARVLRWSSLALGVVGGLLLLLLSRPTSKLTFGTYERAGPVALLALAVLFRTVGAGQAALIQGLRRIPDLAKSTVFGGILGTLASIALVFLFRERGIVPSLIAIEAALLLFSWRYSRRVGLEAVTMTPSFVVNEGGALLKLGFAFMTSGMLAMGAAYAVRLIVARKIGLDAAGLYQSAWTVGGLYVGFVLQAMGADFYPRLTAAITDHDEANRLVNEQAQVSMLLAGPGVLGTLTFAPLIVPLFYSMAFLEGVELLRWLCIGVALRVITWPMGIVIVAHGRQSVFLFVEIAYTLVFLALAWTGVHFLGLNGSGMAFFGSYVFHGLMLYPVVRWITGFRWSAANLKLGAAFLAAIGVLFGLHYLLRPWLATTIGAAAVVATSYYSLRTLVRLVPPHRLPSAVQRVAGWLGVLPQSQP
jgi:antigen flippase